MEGQVFTARAAVLAWY